MAENELMDLARSQKYETLLNLYQQYPIESIAEVADFLRIEDVYKVAIKLYQYLLQHQDSVDLHYGVGQCYGKIYNYQTSLYHLDKAFTLTSRTAGANYYAYILERSFLMDRAYDWYHKALDNGYDDLWTLSHYAYFLEKYNKTAEAEQAYKDVLTKNPAYTWAVKRYAVFLLKQNEPARSIQVMQDILEQYPNNPFVKLNYLEYLMIREMADEYDEFYHTISQSIIYQELIPFQVLIDLFDYFWKFLLKGKTDHHKIKSYEQKVNSLKDSIHRDFDDLDDLLAARNGDMIEWKGLIDMLLK